MASKTVQASARALRHINAQRNVCRQCVQATRSITTVSYTSNPEEPIIPTKLAHSLAYRSGPQTQKDFQRLANERRAELGTPRSPKNRAPRGPKRLPTSNALAIGQAAGLQSRIVMRLPSKRTPPTKPVALRSQLKNQEASKSTTVDESLHTLLPLLQSQPPFYAQILIHGNPYLVTLGDKITLPFLMHGVEPGDVLRLDRVSIIGSRDYTLKAGAGPESTTQVQPASPEDTERPIGHTMDGSIIAASKAESSIHHGTAPALPTLPDSLYTIRATVLGVETEPMRIMEKTKRRQRHTKHVKSKHRYTVLRISDLQLHGVKGSKMQAAPESSSREDPTLQEQLQEGKGEAKDNASIPEKGPTAQDSEPAAPEKVEDQLHKTGP